LTTATKPGDTLKYAIEIPILFLDELSEFARSVLEALRGSFETGLAALGCRRVLKVARTSPRRFTTAGDWAAQ
jgi:hypothetical protein